MSRLADYSAESQTKTQEAFIAAAAHLIFTLPNWMMFRRLWQAKRRVLFAARGCSKSLSHTQRSLSLNIQILDGKLIISCQVVKTTSNKTRSRVQLFANTRRKIESFRICACTLGSSLNIYLVRAYTIRSIRRENCLRDFAFRLCKQNALSASAQLLFLRLAHDLEIIFLKGCVTSEMLCMVCILAEDFLIYEYLQFPLYS